MPRRYGNARAVSRLYAEPTGNQAMIQRNTGGTGKFLSSSAWAVPVGMSTKKTPLSRSKVTRSAPPIGPVNSKAVRLWKDRSLPRFMMSCGTGGELCSPPDKLKPISE